MKHVYWIIVFAAALMFGCSDNASEDDSFSSADVVSSTTVVIDGEGGSLSITAGFGVTVRALSDEEWADFDPALGYRRVGVVIGGSIEKPVALALELAEVGTLATGAQLAVPLTSNAATADAQAVVRTDGGLEVTASVSAPGIYVARDIATATLQSDAGPGELEVGTEVTFTLTVSPMSWSALSAPALAPGLGLGSTQDWVLKTSDGTLIGTNSGSCIGGSGISLFQTQFSFSLDSSGGLFTLIGSTSVQCKGADCSADIHCTALDTECGRGQCNPQSQCVFGAYPNTGVVCDNGLGECIDGLCVSGKYPCDLERVDQVIDPCENAFGDGNLCNGTLSCKQSGTKWTCKNPNAPVVCQDMPCATSTCDPKTGNCVEIPSPAGASCSILSEFSALRFLDLGSQYDSCRCDGTGLCLAPNKRRCDCEKDDDCVDPDNDLCTGIPYCNLMLKMCTTNPGTVVAFEGSKEPGGHCLNQPAAVGKAYKYDPCLQNTCHPMTGECTLSPEPGAKACDDGQICTVDDTCSEGQCVGEYACACEATVGCASEEDGNLCNGTLYCDESSGDPLLFECIVNPATIVPCDAAKDSPCEVNQCDPATGLCAMTAVSDKPETECDDGNKCTVGDACKSGTCQPGTDVCECQSNADCASKEDGNLCNGTLFCNLNGNLGGANTCTLNPATVVTCPSVNNTGCKTNTCNPSTGLCSFENKPDKNACDDNNKCTIDDQCKKGICEPGSNDCECQSDADCACEKDCNLCNGTLYCDKAVTNTCKLNPTTIITCATVDNTTCKTNTCDPTTGLCSFENEPAETSCDDGNPCTQGDTCSSGICKSGNDVCECQFNTDCTSKEDGNLCNGTLYCDKMPPSNPSLWHCKVSPPTVVNCPANNDTTCTKNTCAPTKGTCSMVAAPTGTSCSDDNACTLGDSCQSGACQPGTDVCECKTNSDCFDDKNPCNGKPFCDKAQVPFVCKANPATVVSCPTDQNTGCQTSTCNPDTGACSMVKAVDGLLCDDGNKCTDTDSCLDGVCKEGVFSCCVSDAQCKDDDNQCNGVPKCDKASGYCKTDPATIVICKTAFDTACWKNLCVPSGGYCQADQLADGTACDDGKACTIGDTCQQNICTPGVSKCACSVAADCESDNPCVTHGCDAAGICQLEAMDPGTACDDGDPCTTDEACDNGYCTAATWACPCNEDWQCKDDGNLCNGIPKCDQTTGHCAVDPSTVTVCNAQLDSPCQYQLCIPAGGYCNVEGTCLEGETCVDTSGGSPAPTWACVPN